MTEEIPAMTHLAANRFTGAASLLRRRLSTADRVWPLANLSTVFRRLFGLISWFFRLHSKDLTACGIDANFFGVFRSGFRNINGPEALF